MNTKRILITGGRSMVAVDAAKNFCESGYDVYVAESLNSHLCKVSKYVKKSFKVSAPRTNEAMFVDEVIQIMKTHDIGLLLPTCEETFYVSKHKAAIESATHGQVYTDDLEKLHRLHHKQHFVELLKSLSLPYPETLAVTLIDEGTSNRLKQHFGPARLVSKPAYSRFGSKVSILNASDDLAGLVASPENPLLFQQFIEGVQICVYATCIDGRVTSLTQYSSMFKVGLGSSLNFMSVDNQKIAEICQVLIEKMSFTGQISFDFIVDDTGACYPIECNPRATSGLHLLVLCNSLEDFIVSGDFNRKAVYGPNCMLALPLLLVSLPKIRSIKHLKDLWHVWMTSKDVLLHRGQLGPFLYQWVMLASFLSIAKRERISILEATTFDIEWNGDL